MRALFITRKYPPSVGGMENLSYNLTTGIGLEKKIIALGQSQWNLIWFIPYALLYSIKNINKFDVIHISDPVLSIIGFVIKRLFPNKKVATTLHGLDLTFNSKIYQYYINKFGKNFDLYISISKNTDELAKSKGFINTKIIPVGIDINKFSNVITKKKEFRKKYGAKEDDFIILTIGRLVKRKGVAWFLKNVMVKLNNENIKYFIIGDGPEKEEIVRIISENKLQDNVQMLGRLSEQDLLEAYKNSDIFVMPNIIVDGDVEGFGIVSIEASLAGLVFLGSGIEGIKDAIKNGINGFLVETENVDEYLYRINDIINNYETYKDFILESQRYTREKYGWENICFQYKREFEKLTNNEHRGKYAK